MKLLIPKNRQETAQTIQAQSNSLPEMPAGTLQQESLLKPPSEVPIILVIAVINKNTIVTAIRIALGFLCTLCVASAAENGIISAKSAPVAVVKQDSTKPVTARPVTQTTKSKPLDLSLTRHTSSFRGPPGPTLAVGARYVLTPTPGLSRLDNFGQISKGEYVYDWPPGAKIIAAAPVAVTPAIAPTATASAQPARR